MRRAVATVVLVALAACSSGDSDDSGDSDVGGTTEARPAAGPIDDGVVGTWTADGSDDLTAALADQGLDDVPTCTGTVTLDLDADGAFRRTAEGECDFGETRGAVELTASGTYATEDGELVLGDVTSSGRLLGDDGEELALPDQSVDEGGSLAYRVEGDDLVLTLGRIDQAFTRA